MKGNEVEYVIPLSWVFTQPKTKRTNKTIGVIKKFVKKHTRKTDVYISREVNECLWKQSRQPPRRITVILQAEGEQIRVFLKGGKELEEQKKAKKTTEERHKKEKAEKAKAKTDTAAPKGAKTEKAAAEEQQKKAEDKKAMEKAARATDMKRGQ